jgi:hypothetical protein
MIWMKKFGTGVQTISLNQNSKGLYWLVAEGCSQKIFIQ